MANNRKPEVEATQKDIDFDKNNYQIELDLRDNRDLDSNSSFLTRRWLVLGF